MEYIYRSSRLVIKLFIIGLVIITKSNLADAAANGEIHKTVYPLGFFGPKSSINANSITMSGFASGAYMAMQFHFAHSSILKGAGMFNGGPYAKGYGLPTGALPGAFNFFRLVLLPGKPVPQLLQQAKRFESGGKIDALSNLNGARAFVYHGRLDPLINYSESQRAANMYQRLGTNVKLYINPTAGHGMPTDNYGGPCQGVDFVHDIVNNCGYEGVFEMLGHLLDNFKRPRNSSASAAPGFHLYRFDQKPFIPAGYNANASRAYMAPYGYIYIPPGCQDPKATCRLHVSLQGCLQSIYDEFFPNQFVLKTGYIQAADVNNIVVVFPQGAPRYLDIDHSNWSCWDFFGGTSPDFPTKMGPQIQSIYNIIAGITRKT